MRHGVVDHCLSFLNDTVSLEANVEGQYAVISITRCHRPEQLTAHRHRCPGCGCKDSNVGFGLTHGEFIAPIESLSLYHSFTRMTKINNTCRQPDAGVSEVGYQSLQQVRPSACTRVSK